MIPEWKWLAWCLYANDLAIDPPTAEDAASGQWVIDDWVSDGTTNYPAYLSDEAEAKFGARAQELIAVRDAMESYKQLAGETDGDV